MTIRRDMLDLAQHRRSHFRSLLLFLSGIAIPIVLWAASVDPRIFVLSVLLSAGVWTVAWMDLGFLLGGILFWSAVIVLTQASIEPGQVDNFLPGLVVVFG